MNNIIFIIKIFMMLIAIGGLVIVIDKGTSQRIEAIKSVNLKI